MKKIKLYQVFYKDDHLLDVGTIPVDARKIDPKPLYENKHILDVYPKLKGADYYGLTSWRMREKIGLNKKQIDDFINIYPGCNAYLYGQYGNENVLIENIKSTSNIGLVWKRLFELGIFKNKNISEEKWINCFANYWIADKPTWNRYIVYLQKTIKLLDTDPVLKWIMGKVTFPHRGEPYPLHPFILEYLFGLFLKDNPDIIYTILPNSINASNQKINVKAFNPMTLSKTLAEIYESHKTPAGMGDKGTLHHYIENYEKLFRQYRYKPVTVLEIGIEQGHSLRMWRDYFARARIIGIDIKESKLETPGCETFLCDQNDGVALDAFLTNQTFDVIVDDGSHLFEHQVTSFKHLFPRLKEGGIYVIEDIQKPETEIPEFIKLFGKCEIYDTRKESGRYDDILLVWRK